MTTVSEIVSADLCVGCGLCEAVTGGRVRMTMTPGGSLRPAPLDGFDAGEEQVIIDACPGVVAEARATRTLPLDPIWGHHGTMCYAWARDPAVRHSAASGGVLTALGVHLIGSGRAAFILHIGADPARPMRSRWVISETMEDVLTNTGSRYGPTAPLAGLGVALARNQPFAVIAKPCDLGALHRLAASDSRIDRLIVARLTMVCGGQSRLTKTERLLSDHGLEESAVSLVRYRGHGNPGPTRIETHDGRTFETSYLELWEDEDTWELETRCKLCPDALGEAADVVAADVWPGGAPAGEDAGFNGIIVRSTAGQALVDEAGAGPVALGNPISPRRFDAMQPHQVRKKLALAARYRGMADAGISPIATYGLRIDELGERLPADEAATERAGTAKRMEAAR